MKKCVLSILITALCSIITVSAETYVRGSLRAYPDTIVHLRYFSDEITKKEVIVASSELDSVGNFEFCFELDEVHKCFIDLGVYRAVLFVEPTKTYDLKKMPYVPKSDAQLFNVFFTPKEVLANLKNTPADDINQDILNFELAIDEVWNNALFADVSTQYLRAAIDSIDGQFVSKNPYFNTYKQSTYALLANLHIELSPFWSIQEYFVPMTVSYSNPAYWEAFFVLFDGFFNHFEYESSAQEVIQAYKQANLPLLKEKFASLMVWNNPRLEELVLLYNLWENYNSKPEDKEHARSLIEQIQRTSPFAEHKQIATGILSNLQRAQIGTKPADYKLLNLSGKAVSLRNFEGKFVYVVFASSFITESRADIAYLQQLAKRYPDDIAVIFVFSNETLSTTVDYIQEAPADIVITNWDNNKDMLQAFGVHNIPSYYLLDRDGYFIHSPALSPSEGFERKFDAILQLEKAANEGSTMNKPFF